MAQNWWDDEPVSGTTQKQPRPAQRPIGGPVVIKPADPTLDSKVTKGNADAKAAGDTAPYAGPQAAADLEGKRLDNEKLKLEAAKAESEQTAKKNRANTIRGLSANLRALYEADIKGQPLSRAFGATEYFPTIPANNRFNAAANQILPMIRPLLAQSAKEGDSDKEMTIFQSYIPQAGDADITIERKLAGLDALLGGMIDGRSPSEIEQALNASRPVNSSGNPTQSNATIPGGPVLPQAGGGNNFNLSPSEGPPPTLTGGGNAEFATEVDRAFSQEAQEAFNNGANLEQLNAIADRYNYPHFNGGQVDAAIQARASGRPVQFTVPKSGQQDTGLTGQILGSMANSPVGSYFIGAGDALTMGGLDEIAGALGGAPGVAQVAKDVSADNNMLSTLAGNVTGGAATTLGLGKVIGGIPMVGSRLATMGGGILPDLLYGAGYGAGSDNDDRAVGALMGGGAGVLGNLAGRGIAGGGGRIMRGVRDPSVRQLDAAGIQMTPGQIMSQSGRIGQMAKGVEDRLAGMPFIGDMINARRLEGLQGFNRAAFDEALAPIGRTTDDIAEQGIAQAQRAVGSAYDDALSGVNISPDQQFIQEMGDVRNSALNIPNHGPTLEHTLDANLGNLFGQTGDLSGQNLQAAIQTLRQEAPTYTGSPLGMEASQALRDAEGAIAGLVGRQSPSTMSALNNANEAYRNLSVLQDLVGDSAKNTDGIFTPAQLNMRSVQNRKSFGGKAANARGDRSFFELGRAGQQVLPSKVPDSGTAGRLALPTMLAGGGASAGYLTGSPLIGAALGLTMSAPATGVGARVAQRALLDRPAEMVRVGDMMINKSALSGRLGALLAIGQSQ